MCQPEAPFYLQVHPSWDMDVNGQPSQVWFKNQPLGEHTLGNMMKQMAHQAELPGHKTNHSGRKTTVKRLKEANFENTSYQTQECAKFKLILYRTPENHERNVSNLNHLQCKGDRRKQRKFGLSRHSES
ncbi:hypothetical protein DPMN_186946 [Dreissena polymorpha]|uniref:Uncharacterized protein n=1 Tax=Dreissena polymorpha TaxID=45954 RepID=A0A9D4DQ18_DREPO|nr:hypothetical protein DPMN_186946 [Dreissena polymorpha]